MQKSVIFARGAIKSFDPQLFGLKSLTSKLIFIPSCLLPGIIPKTI